MLLFKGIHLEDKKLQRYAIEYNLRKSYIYTHNILEQQKQNIPKALDILQQEVDNLYKNHIQLPLSPKNNFAIAVKIRSKDILLFFQRYKFFGDILRESLKILILAVSVQKKWEHLLKIFVQKEFTENFLQQKKNRDFIEDFLMFVWLGFLDQITETPPMNLRLYFISGEFPKCNWSVTDYSEKIKIKEWQPAEEVCQLNFLRLQLYRVIHSKEAFFQSLVAEQSQNITGILQKIKLAYSTDKEQEKIFESSPEEVLQIFIQEILEEYRNQKGSNHLIAILYQIQKNYRNGKCSFYWQEHFELISKRQTLTNLKKQIIIAKEIFQKLQNLKVIRVFQENTIFEIKKSLITILSNTYFPQQKFLKKNLQQNRIELQVDSIIIPEKKDFISFSSSLCFLPLELLKETQRTYPFLVFLGVYLYDCWFCEYSHLQGKTKKTIQELIEGSFVKVTDSKKYRVAQRIRSALQYLKQKNYIGNYQLCFSAKNILETSYTLLAPTDFHQKMEEFSQKKSDLFQQEKQLLE